MKPIAGLSEETNETLFESFKHLDEKLLKYHEACEECLLLNDFNIQERALASANISLNLVTALFAEQRILKKIEDKKEEYLEEYLKNHGKPNVVKFKTIEEAKSSEVMLKIEKALDAQQTLVQYLMDVVKIAKGYQWDIKNCVSLMNLDK